MGKSSDSGGGEDSRVRVSGQTRRYFPSINDWNSEYSLTPLATLAYNIFMKTLPLCLFFALVLGSTAQESAPAKAAAPVTQDGEAAAAAVDQVADEAAKKTAAATETAAASLQIQERYIPLEDLKKIHKASIANRYIKEPKLNRLGPIKQVTWLDQFRTRYIKPYDNPRVPVPKFERITGEVIMAAPTALIVERTNATKDRVLLRNPSETYKEGDKLSLNSRRIQKLDADGLSEDVLFNATLKDGAKLTVVQFEDMTLPFEHFISYLKAGIYIPGTERLIPKPKDPQKLKDHRAESWQKYKEALAKKEKAGGSTSEASASREGIARAERGIANKSIRQNQHKTPSLSSSSIGSSGRVSIKSSGSIGAEARAKALAEKRNALNNKSNNNNKNRRR